MSEDASIQLDDIKDRLSIASQPPPYLSDKMIRGKDQGDYNRKGLELAVATGFNVVALGATIAMLINRQIGPLWGGVRLLKCVFSLCYFWFPWKDCA